LHPLWDLMDDMCSLKSIEVLGEAQKLGSEEDIVSARNLFRQHFLASPSLCRGCKCRQNIPVADELMQLKSAFDKLHTAMLSWSKYVPIILLKQLFEAHIEASIGCSFVEVSVVFIAIHDFQNVCEDMNAQEVLELMGDVLNGIYDALDENGGTMLEFIGDEVLAVFNAPARVPGFEMSAVCAALEAQENVKRLGHRDVSLECSVHKARVLAGNIGSPTRMKYGVLGDGVNLSARLKSLNTRYNTKLLVSSEALDFPGAEDLFLTRPVGNLILKGRTTPTRTFEVINKQGLASHREKQGAEKHKKAFELFTSRRFVEAKAMFTEVHDLLWMSDGSFGQGDKVSQHFVTQCEKYIETPPPQDWDGSEHLTKKVF